MKSDDLEKNNPLSLDEEVPSFIINISSNSYFYQELIN